MPFVRAFGAATLGEQVKMVRLPLLFFFVLILRSTFASTPTKSASKVSSNGTQQNQCGQWFSKECCCCRDGRDGRDGQNGKDGRDGRDGKNGEKGQKGEQGFFRENGAKGQKGEPELATKRSQGAIKFGDTADNCTLLTAGTVRFSDSHNSLQLCDGSAWLPLMTAGKGQPPNKSGRHCLDILNSGHSHGNGLYWIDPNGGPSEDSFQAFCDMETEGGGWTLVATKFSPSFLFIKAGFSTLAAKSKYTDAASHIHPDMENWKEVMFRFSNDSNIRTIYNRKAGAPQKGKTEFEEFLMGKSAKLRTSVYGFYKYSPADHNKKSPAVGFDAISTLFFYSDRGISEVHNGGSDKWLDMWNDADVYNNNYIFSDDSKARGTKCIAGYCYLNKPIWVMVR
ncbi:collagen alpha chain-like isoform X5 [Orbicella faveolata]|uniref:collagen alpha chain-like isoform X5 n=1 Tax=Orbicella faveolata TaxID=48498 RepID=UPI0009E65B6B|nr:collagen alpha chain-like isoform X5 [Orbicella faveolata]